MQSLAHEQVIRLICNIYEVLEHIPSMEGATCSCSSTWFGGLKTQSQRAVQESKYGKNQGDFKQISVIAASVIIANSIS